MAHDEHVAILEKGVEEWNRWRSEITNVRPNLDHADLSARRLQGIDLHKATARWVNLSNSRLAGADLRGADLEGANLRGTELRGADLSDAVLRRSLVYLADLSKARMRGTNLGNSLLVRTQMIETDLLSAVFYGTVLADLDLRHARHLETCRHFGPSSIDSLTLEKSGRLPEFFLRGTGMSDSWIEYLPTLHARPLQFYSCFISFSSEDQDFTQRLHADLQDNGVRCWFAPEDMKIGSKILDTLDEAIRLRDKLLLVLSNDSVQSAWVEDEVTKAFAEERQRSATILFPIRIDDAVMDSDKAWAAKIRDNRHIGDFREWKDHDNYQEAFKRLLRDLKVVAKGTDLFPAK